MRYSFNFGRQLQNHNNNKVIITYSYFIYNSGRPVCGGTVYFGLITYSYFIYNSGRPVCGGAVYFGLTRTFGVGFGRASRWFRLFFLSCGPGVGFGRRALAVVSFIWVSRVRCWFRVCCGGFVCFSVLGLVLVSAAARLRWFRLFELLLSLVLFL